MSGLQAWDGNGNLIVDIGDFSTRFVTRQKIYFPNNTQSVSFGVGGINGYNSFAAIMGWDIQGFPLPGAYHAVTRQDAVDIFYLPTRNPTFSCNLYLEVYMFN